ncbi:putative Late nodulin [Medicago truncatula]|uniref:Nodule Cysteine-Rich (NCR) secreted peptide n=1 Tax=Medicago truncatula TaxID=3880 RepID=A7KHC8_MEDTR|nr:nodule-specific cysteine-rich peptide 263 [Medicago truncatula]AES69683.1 Nodule Cysteine-Rich (NCR) secreted peptide [Medicago truncatula]RHN66350.1 putative Late nodulin [Medicago truncatula]
MDEVFKFVYVMIIFPFLILDVATNAEKIRRCFNDAHCPPDMCTLGVIPKCSRFTICIC